MPIKREWATPTVIGAFTLSGLTGIALFFGWKSQVTLTIHQWLGLTFVLGGLLHIASNFFAFKRHFRARLAKTIVSIYIVLTIVAFLPLGPSRPPNSPMSRVLDTLQRAPVEDLAQIFKASPQVLIERLNAAGFHAASAKQSIADVAGPDFEKRMGAMGALAGDGSADRSPPSATASGKPS